MNVHSNLQLQLVTGSAHTQKALYRQLTQYFGDSLTIYPIIIDEPSDLQPQHIFTLFSSQEVYEFSRELGWANRDLPCVIAERTIVYEKLDKILLLPRDEDILLVNDSEESALEVIRHLQHMGFDFLHFVPYFPGCSEDISHIRIAVTPGELDKTPGNIHSVYDIGVRVMSFSTIARLLHHFDLLDERINACYETYTRSLMDFAKQVSNVAYQASSLVQTVRPELIGRGYYAKYHFDDIIGSSSSIQNVKDIAGKIARTDLSVLIEGDNGTGKELFASAIHNASHRIRNPFVAINFSALPDELIESELFGYEEGSFTGAKKGGRTGLFEQANGGTIFLDEIGDISPRMQAKLLRVLQEREILRVGGNRIIPIDVRVIAATNQNLAEQIRQGRFRQDLYYRLAECRIQIPPLSEREEDIPVLINHWLHQYGIDWTISPEALSMLLTKDWPGNVRELRNSIKYAAALARGHRIESSDLPYDEGASALGSPPDRTAPSDILTYQILDAVKLLQQQGSVAGRAKIQAHLQSQGFSLSEYHLRSRLADLLQHGYLQKAEGRYGYQLTWSGSSYVTGKV